MESAPSELYELPEHGGDEPAAAWPSPPTVDAPRLTATAPAVAEEIQRLLAAARGALEDAAAAPSEPSSTTLVWPDWSASDPATATVAPATPAQTTGVRLVVGRLRMTPGECAVFRRGTPLPLQPAPADAVEIYVAGQLRARGTLLVLDGCLGVRLTEVLAFTPSRETLDS